MAGRVAAAAGRPAVGRLSSDVRAVLPARVIGEFSEVCRRESFHPTIRVPRKAVYLQVTSRPRRLTCKPQQADAAAIRPSYERCPEANEYESITMFKKRYDDTRFAWTSLEDRSLTNHSISETSQSRLTERQSRRTRSYGKIFARLPSTPVM